MTLGHLITGIFIILYIIGMVDFTIKYGSPFTYKDDRTHMGSVRAVSLILSLCSGGIILILLVLIMLNWELIIL